MRWLMPLGKGRTFRPVDTGDDPLYDVNLFNPKPQQEESQVNTAPKHAIQFPVGTRVRKMPGATYPKGVADTVTGVVENHSKVFVHVNLEGKIYRMFSDEIMKVSDAEEARVDVNRVYFNYKGKPRSGILNRIEIHPTTRNILMWVREDGTGDLKAFDLSRLDYITLPDGARAGQKARAVLVEGIES